MNNMIVKGLKLFFLFVTIGVFLGITLFNSLHSITSPKVHANLPSSISQSMIDELEFMMPESKIIDILGDPQEIISNEKKPTDDNGEAKRLCYSLSDGSQYAVIINRRGELMAGGMTK